MKGTRFKQARISLAEKFVKIQNWKFVEKCGEQKTNVRTYSE